jgi:hypothetical protein
MIWKLWYRILSTLCKCHYFNFSLTIFRTLSKITSYFIINFQWTLQQKNTCRGYSHSANNVYCANMATNFWEKSCQAKICNLGIKIYVKQNVGWFDVSMYYWGLYILMKVLETASYSDTYVFSNWPIHVEISFPLCFRNKIIKNNLRKQLAYLIKIITSTYYKKKWKLLNTNNYSTPIIDVYFRI